MKILQLHIGMDLMGGIESMICNLANEMIKEHEVTVCSVFKPQSDHSPCFLQMRGDWPLHQFRECSRTPQGPLKDLQGGWTVVRRHRSLQGHRGSQLLTRRPL